MSIKQLSPDEKCSRCEWFDESPRLPLSLYYWPRLPTVFTLLIQAFPCLYIIDPCLPFSSHLWSWPPTVFTLLTQASHCLHIIDPGFPRSSHYWPRLPTVFIYYFRRGFALLSIKLWYKQCFLFEHYLHSFIDKEEIVDRLKIPDNIFDSD